MSRAAQGYRMWLVMPGFMTGIHVFPLPNPPPQAGEGREGA
jgi:hypothetical protein